MAINKLGVLGAGSMGSGIAQVGAQSGLQVVLVDLEQKMVDKALKNMNKNWDKDLSRGKLTEEGKAQNLANITGSTHTIDLKDCELVIEVIVENLEIKKRVFKELNDICQPSTVIASNTSGFSITEIAAAIGPLALCDLVGIDVLLMVVEYFYKEFGDPKFRPALALKQKVRAGHYGIKSGKGFYDYAKA